MIYVARKANGQYTGAAYFALTPEAVAHHARFGETLVPVAGLVADGDGWLAVEPTLDEARAIAAQKIANWVERLTARYTAGVSFLEIASWPTKALAARAHLAGTPQDIIIGEATVTGEDPDHLADIIARKAQLYTGIIARMTGLRRATEKAVAEAVTAKEVADALDDALATAHDILADLGLQQET